MGEIIKVLMITASGSEGIGSVAPDTFTLWNLIGTH